MKRRPLIRALAAVGALGWLTPGWTRVVDTPIRILVGASPGGTTDALARGIAPEMGRLLARTIIVENRPGAGGNVAANAVARAQPDGDTLLLSFTSHTINATLFPDLPFDPVADFTPLTKVATSPSILVAHPSLPVNSLRELIEYTRARPGQLNFAIGGIGSSLHLAGEDFKIRARVFIVNIPFAGAAPAVAAVTGGHVQLMFAAVGNVRTLIEAGRLKALGVTGKQRLPQFPNVPAIAEVLPSFESSAWFGLFGPAGMSPELARRHSDAARAAVQTEAFLRRLELDGAQAVGNSPEEFARFVKADIPRWADLVRRSGATPN